MTTIELMMEVLLLKIILLVFEIGFLGKARIDFAFGWCNGVKFTGWKEERNSSGKFNFYRICLMSMKMTMTTALSSLK